MTDLAEGEKPSSKAKWQLNLIIFVSVVPIFMAYLAYYTGIGVPTSTVNEGELLLPAVQINELRVDDESKLPQFGSDKTWRLFIPVPAQCDKQCQHHLYIARQVNIRLANKTARVERYAVSLGGVDSDGYLQRIKAEYPRMQVVSASLPAWEEWLAGTNLSASVEKAHYYLLADPVGNVMMFYTAAQDGNQLLKDIKRILRHTPED